MAKAKKDAKIIKKPVTKKPVVKKATTSSGVVKSIKPKNLVKVEDVSKSTKVSKTIKPVEPIKKTRTTKTVKTLKVIPQSEPIKQHKLKKPDVNPIITPNGGNGWESWQTFNPGVVQLDDKTHFFYRAIGDDGVSRLGYANSVDGFKIDERLPYPVYEHRRGHGYHMNAYSFASGWGFGGAEDPRVTTVEGDDRLYMTYTACDHDLRVGLTSIKLIDFLKKKWNWKSPILLSPPGETNKNWVLFPEKINGKYAIMHSISPKIGISYFDDLDFDDGTFIKSDFSGKVGPDSGCFWECYVRGVGASPIRTKHGWLILYHALQKGDSGKYKVGAMLLDLNNPEKILYRSKGPILEPEETYENEGFKSGIVYVTGVIEKDGKLMVYYGGADSYVNVAYADLEEFLNNLMANKETKLKAIKNTKTKK